MTMKPHHLISTVIVTIAMVVPLASQPAAGDPIEILGTGAEFISRTNPGNYQEVLGPMVSFAGYMPDNDVESYIIDSTIKFIEGHPVFGGSMIVGERFAGQGLSLVNGADRLTGLPSTPLQVVAGNPGENLTTRLHTGMINFVLTGQPPLVTGRVGTGSMAFVFVNDIPGFGVVTPNTGTFLTLSFYSRNGQLIDTVEFLTDEAALWFVRENDEVDIAGFTVEHTHVTGNYGIGQLWMDVDLLMVPDACDKGDFNADGFVDLGDVQPFVTTLLDPDQVSLQEQCIADMNADSVVNGLDISVFLDCLMNDVCP